MAPPVATETSVVGAPRVPPVLEQRQARLRRHRAARTTTDAAIIVVASAAAGAAQWQGASAAGYAQVIDESVLFAAVWVLALSMLRHTASMRSDGGRLELAPIIHSAALSITALAILASATGDPLPQTHVLLTTPIAVVALITVRIVGHSPWATARTGRSGATPRALIVGDRAGIEHAIRSLRSARGGNPVVVGTVLEEDGVADLVIDRSTYPVLGTVGQAAQIARELCVDTVIVAAGGDDSDFVRRLSWGLEGAATELVLATRLTDVARSRMTFDRMDGLALTRVGLPRFDRASRRAKRAFDVFVAIVALVPIALVTPVIALLISLDTPGGVFFRQRRIGRDGREFDILKFRTMCASAEAQRAHLESQNEGAGPLFKLKNDPRVTRVGAVLRRFSLDELPQFWNVLRGEMSVVGPRPPLPSEVRGYDGTVLRRLYVQPGITGLWQVSGRSDLTWEQSVRLDLHYVENWSVATDARIVLKTAGVLVRPRGAY